MPPRSDADPRLLAKVGALYYLQNQTQQQIADRLRLSRPGVSRLLGEARQRGIVQISVVPQDDGAGEWEAADLQAELEAAYGLHEAVVTPPGPGGLAGRLGAAAAAYLARTVVPGMTVGVTWGTSLREMVRALRPAPVARTAVVQMTGGVGPDGDGAHAADLSRRLAALLGADLHVVQAPGVVSSPAVRDALLADPYVRRAVDAAGSVDVAFVGVGALSTNPALDPGPEGAVPDGLRDRLGAAGAVGDVALRFLDADGQPVLSPLDDRLVGVDLPTLRALPHVVGVAGGPAKVVAVRAALRAGLLDVLVTDVRTATLLVGRPAPNEPPVAPG